MGIHACHLACTLLARGMSSISQHINQAIERLRAGKLIALPTETVYGLAGDACNDAAVAQIFAMKGRPSFNPLIVHVPDVAIARDYVQWNERAAQLAAAFWPGPLTLVLPRREGCLVSYLAGAGGDTLAVRMPAHPVAQAVLTAFGGGIAAPSANRSGKISPTTALHVQTEFPDSDVLIMEGGACAVGIESTVVDCTAEAGVVILRPGSITQTQIEALGMVEHHSQAIGGDYKSPGMLASHYAPNLPVRLNAVDVVAGEALLAFGNAPIAGAAITLNLSECSDLVQAASRLFAHLRELDQPIYSGIAVMPIPERDLGIAINDRLRRAAAERS